MGTEIRIILTLLIILAFSAPAMAQSAVISRVFIPPIVVENETLMLKVIAFSAQGWRVSGNPVDATVTITDYYNKTEIFQKQYSVFGEEIIYTTPLKRGVYTVTIQFVGGRTYADEVLVRPPPVPYYMDVFDKGFTFKSDHNFTIIAYVERENEFVEWATWDKVQNLTVEFPPDGGRYKVYVVDQWGWVNAFHNRDYWTGRGEPYTWNFKWTHEQPARSKLPETTILNVLVVVVGIIIVVVVARR